MEFFDYFLKLLIFYCANKIIFLLFGNAYLAELGPISGKLYHTYYILHVLKIILELIKSRFGII